MKSVSKLRGMGSWLGLAGIWACVGAGAAAEKPAGSPPITPAEMLALFTDTKEAVYSDWSDLNSDSQAWSKKTKEGHVAVRNEGRVHNGSDQYHKAFKKRPEGVNFWCRTGESEGSHLQTDAGLLKKGYVLVWVQAFIDSKGAARYQGLWVKVAEAPTDAAG